MGGDVFYEGVLQNIVKAKPSIIYDAIDKCSGRTLLHNVFRSTCLPSMSIIRLLAGRSFLSVIQDNDGCVPLHYVCAICVAIDFSNADADIYLLLKNIMSSFHPKQSMCKIMLESILMMSTENSKEKSMPKFIGKYSNYLIINVIYRTLRKITADGGHCSIEVYIEENLSNMMMKHETSNHPKSSWLSFTDKTNKTNTTRNVISSSGEDSKKSKQDFSSLKVDTQFWEEYVRTKSDGKAKDDLYRQLRFQLNDAHQQLLSTREVNTKYTSKIQAMERPLTLETEMRKEAEEYVEHIMSVQQGTILGEIDHSDSKGLNADNHLFGKLLKCKEKNVILCKRI